jgi:hypothetical protein
MGYLYNLLQPHELVISAADDPASGANRGVIGDFGLGILDFGLGRSEQGIV